MNILKSDHVSVYKATLGLGWPNLWLQIAHKFSVIFLTPDNISIVKKGTNQSVIQCISVV